MQQLPAPPIRSLESVFHAVAIFALVTGLLYFGAGILVPLVLSVLMAFALAPLVGLLGRRLRLPDPLAVVVAVVLALFVLACFSYLVGTQFARLAADLPQYQSAVSSKFALIKDQLGGRNGLFQNIIEAIDTLEQQFGSGQPGASTENSVPVRITNDLASPLGMVTGVLGSVLGPLATGAIVTVFLIFLLMGREDLQERFIRLVGRGDYSTTNLALNDASARVGRYLLIQVCINVCYGIIFATGLAIIGVPGAMLWGLMIVVFRYIPFVGALLVAVMPIGLALAVDSGWTMVIVTAAFFVVLDQTVANVVEPRLYGSSTGVSPVAILLSAMFWATLWGPVGLVLSTPITVCLVVIGRYIPQLQVFETLFGSDPVLEPKERLYQRMLRGDIEEAVEIAEEEAEETDEDEVFEDLVSGALALAATELSDAPEALAQRSRIAETTEALIEEFAVEMPEPATILIVGGRTEIDEAQAKVMARQLATEGVGSKVLPPIAVRQESIGQVELDGISAICLCYLGADIKVQTRYVARRLHRMAPDMEVIVCHLHPNAASETAADLRVDKLVRSVAEATDYIAERFKPATAPESLAERFTIPRDSAALVAALEEVAEAMGVPLATINLLSDERHRDDADAYRLTQTVTESGDPLIAGPQDTEEPNLYLQSNGIDFYAAVPLLVDDEPVGALAIIAYEPRTLSDEEVERLKELATQLVAKVRMDARVGA
ncbi:AI-2E family transporter [Paradevosia shaoguanensis]|uniref:AI-2E family transporter n=1 Tax=Paradevosia shaoguanensis TaxID=1335043 RepID=UPI003C74315A